MTVMKNLSAVALSLTMAISGVFPAYAYPLSPAGGMTVQRTDVQQIDHHDRDWDRHHHGRDWDRDDRHDDHHHHHHNNVGAVLGGVAAGAIIGGALSNQRRHNDEYYDDGY